MMRKFIYLFLTAIIFVGMGRSVSAEANATINVANGKVEIVADGQCSFLEALENANYPTGQLYTDCPAATPGGANTINLAAGGSYVFTTRHFAIDTYLTINGGGATLDHEDYQFFFVQEEGTLTLNNMTIQGSDGIGAAVFSRGNLYINNVTFRDNVRSNGPGAAVEVLFRAAGTRAEIRSSIFRNNVAGSGGAVGIQLGVNGVVNEVLIDDVTFEGNGSSDSAPSLTASSAGALSFKGNDEYPQLQARIVDSTFTGNEAGAGGGLHVRNNANVTIERTTFDNNSGYESGGGIQVVEATLLVENSTISNNDVPDGNGGGLSNIGGNVTIRNSTISGNSADSGGGFSTAVWSGWHVPATTSLEFVTVAQNEATVDGGGFLNEQPDNTSVSTVTTKNSVFFGNTAPTGKTLDCLNDGGTITSLGYNLHDYLATSGCPFSSTGDDVFTGIFNDHFVNFLATNSGQTNTHRVRNSSLARNRIPLGTNGCLSGTRDQRGVSRNSGIGAGYCDVGAYENTTGAIPTAVSLSSQASSGNDYRVILVVATVLLSLTMLRLTGLRLGSLSIWTK